MGLVLGLGLVLWLWFSRSLSRSPSRSRSFSRPAPELVCERARGLLLLLLLDRGLDCGLESGLLLRPCIPRCRELGLPVLRLCR